MYSTSMILASKSMILASSWENIDIEKHSDGKYRGNIVSNEKAGIAIPNS